MLLDQDVFVGQYTFSHYLLIDAIIHDSGRGNNYHIPHKAIPAHKQII